MPAHASLPDLSSYLDDELAPPRRASLEDHLRGCAGCRGRLEGLRRAVRQLERLDAEAPPGNLGQRVRHRLAAETSRRGLFDRWQGWVERWSGLEVLGPALGAVLALAVILYLLSLGVARQEVAGTTVVVVEPTAAEASDPAAAARRFRHLEGVWVEEGLDQVAPARVVTLADEELEPELANELERLARLGERVRFRFRGEVLELAPANQR